MTTGMDLRLERTAARVRLGHLARAMNRHASTLSRYEGQASVPAAIAAEYRAALATLAENATQEKAA